MAGMQIEDARGTSEGLQVNAEGEALTRADSESRQFHINSRNGKVWSLPWENITNAGANDYVFYIKNTGSANLVLATVQLASDTITQVEVQAVTGTAGGSPTDITPVSRQVGNTVSPSATIVQDPDITGLTTAGTIKYMQLNVANQLYELEIGSGIIIPKGQAVAILIEVTTCLTTGLVTLYEE